MLPLIDQTFQDDWAYIQSVKSFYQTGVLKVSEWVAPSSVSMIIWAWIFTKLFGFSIAIIHFSVVTLLFLALLHFYFLLKKLNISSFNAVIFTLFLLAFPWVFQFTYTFISEVPFMSFSIIALYYFVRGLKNSSSLSVFVGGFFMAISYLTRQTGAVIFVSALLTLLCQSAIERKLLIKKILSLSVPFLFLFLLYNYWLKIPGNLTNPQYQIKVIFKPYCKTVSELFNSEFLLLDSHNSETSCMFLICNLFDLSSGGLML